MTAKIIDGVAIAKSIRAQCRLDVTELHRRTGVSPGLAVILVGNDPASVIYVRNKIRACQEVGITSFKFEFPQDVDPRTVLEKIAALNRDPKVHGILVQLPLPRQFDMAAVLRAIDRTKDVDGFHLYNVGGLVTGNAVYPPCTPYGVMKMLEYEGIRLEGKNVVVVGASNIVGKPMAAILIQKSKQANATVTVCHSQTRDIAAHCRRADILIAALGSPEFVKANMVKPGAVVIDVGVNRIPDSTAKNGSRLVGDVDFANVQPIAGKITPNPGGVGPMTIAILMQNTVRAAEMACGQ